MAQPNKVQSPGESPALVIGSLVAVMGTVLVAALVFLAARLTGNAPDGWAAWLRSRRWSTQASVALAGMLVLLLVPCMGLAVLVVRARRNSEWTDQMASRMSSARDVREMTKNAVLKDSERLGYGDLGPGVVLGRAVRGGAELFSTFEWSQVWIMGTRAGKTRRVAIRQAVRHKGPVVATTNKRDLHDKSRGLRDELGTVWVQDPQEIVGEPATWWWNPLTFVTNVERAERLVSLWSASRTSEQTRGVDPYFEPEGRKFAANLLLAAALGNQPITRLTDWLVGAEPEPGVPDPCVYLEEHGFHTAAQEIRGVWELTSRQRDGITGTSRSFFGFLRDPRFVAWIAPAGPLDQRPQFHPAKFVASRSDTLYLLSKDGPGSARALTGALVMAVEVAGEELAHTSRGGRLPRPLLMVLDEAANICRWPELPDLYSYCGGLGIVLVTMLQSVAQGHVAWPNGGFKKMWSSANILGVGRGMNDADDLRDVSVLVGDYQEQHRSTSSGSQGHHSTSHDVRERRIFTEADLRAFPTGRVVLLASGSRPVLLETIDYSTEPWAAKAEASEAYYSQRTADDMLVSPSHG